MCNKITDRRRTNQLIGLKEQETYGYRYQLNHYDE
jgi:hypothetical protein